jgi:hypothetical protein
MIELSEGTMSVATPGNATSRDCGTSVFECWRRRSNHERHGGKYQAVVRGDRCGVQESYRVFSRPRRAASDIAAETRGESAAEKAGADATATESAVATPTTTATFTTPVTADGKIGQDVQVSCVVPIRPDQQEIQRRLELVRAMFNDFWSGCDDKPAAFVDRLDQAEPYLNERLTACGEFWQLDATTRKMLSLPLRSNSRSEENGAVHR